MNISGDTGATPIDLAKLAEDLPKQLAQMIALRNELALRQGAVSAVEASLKASKEAQEHAKVTKADADSLKNDAKAKHDVAVKKGKDLDAREKAFSDAQSEAKAAHEAAEKAFVARERAVSAREQNADRREAELTAKCEAYEAEKAAFDQRVQSVQAKIAAFSI